MRTSRTPHESKDVGRTRRMASNGRRAGRKRHMRLLPTIREISDLNLYRNHKPSRLTHIVVSTRGARLLALRSARAAADPLTCPKCRSETKIIAVIRDTGEIQCILAHLAKLVVLRQDSILLYSTNEHRDPVASFCVSTAPQGSDPSTLSAFL
jgi:hypothetical protein